MKIFLSFLQGKADHPIPAYSFWEFYIKNGLEEAGHQWVEVPNVDWAEGLVPKSKTELGIWKANVWGRTVDFLKKNKVDLFLSYLYPHQIDEQALKQIQNLGIPCVNYFCDNVREFTKIPTEFAVFDLNWVPEYKALKMYTAAGIKHLHLPMPMWVNPSYRSQVFEENNQFTFIGSIDIQRQLLFEALFSVHPEFPLHIYGSGWSNGLNTLTTKIGASQNFIKKLKHQFDFISIHGLKAYQRKLRQGSFNPPISEVLQKAIKGKPSFEEYVVLTQQSIVTIGVNRYPSFRFPLNQPDTYSRLRDIEAPMLGACYLTEWTEGLNAYYEIGKDILTYKTPSALTEQLELLAKDKQLRFSLRKAGQKKALNEHTIGRSLEQIQNELPSK